MNRRHPEPGIPWQAWQGPLGIDLRAQEVQWQRLTNLLTMGCGSRQQGMFLMSRSLTKTRACRGHLPTNWWVFRPAYGGGNAKAANICIIAGRAAYIWGRRPGLANWDIPMGSNIFGCWWRHTEHMFDFLSVPRKIWESNLHSQCLEIFRLSPPESQPCLSIFDNEVFLFYIVVAE